MFKHVNGPMHKTFGQGQVLPDYLTKKVLLGGGGWTDKPPPPPPPDLILVITAGWGSWRMKPTASQVGDLQDQTCAGGVCLQIVMWSWRKKKG